MALAHIYFGVENLGLSTAQRAILVSELKALGPVAHRSPACLNHWRTNLNGEAVILEALFDEDSLTIAKFKQRLADIFGVAAGSIDHTTNNLSFAGGSTPMVTFNRGGTDYLRLALFGGVGADWNEGGDECQGYLAKNSAEWEGPTT